jgi:TatD DNase family protein
MKPVYINAHCHQLQQSNEWSLFNISSLQDFSINQTCSVGIHPWQIHEFADEDSMVRMREMMVGKNVKAIGECGLDKLCSSPWDRQLEIFRRQIVWAQELNKPMIIHCVRSQQEILKELKGALVKFIFHGFNRNYKMALEVVRHGGYVSMDKNFLLSQQGREVVNQIPFNRLLLETDNEPVSVRDAYIITGQLLGQEIDTVINQININAIEVGLITDRELQMSLF